MKLVKLSDIFDIRYGVNLELNSMQLDSKGIPFVSRTSDNNGVSAFVEPVDGILPNPANTISVACSGSVCEAFLQKYSYYSGRDLFYMIPKTDLSDIQMLFYCACVRSNKYRFSYGRQANRTLKDILVPHPNNIHQWIYNIKFPRKPSSKPYHNKQLSLSDRKWDYFILTDLFPYLKRGSEKINETDEGEIPLISSRCDGNGVVQFIKKGNNLFSKNSITIANNGSIGSSFYQSRDFYTTADVSVIRNKYLNVFVGLFIVTLIEKEKYKYNYGLKWSNKRMKQSKIKLPVDKCGDPDWQFMEDYIKSLPYSSSLESV